MRLNTSESPDATTLCKSCTVAFVVVVVVVVIVRGIIFLEVHQITGM